jgi:S1-C subfamily serine protease
MKRCLGFLIIAGLCWGFSIDQGFRVQARDSDELTRLLSQFERHTGARLVFQASQLPQGSYHDIMPTLSAERQLAAARLAVAELHKLPQGYLQAIGLKAIGIFDRCVSSWGDGFRPYDAKLGGYRYYGIWNGKNGVACAFYTDQQLPLTLHHEVFHHVDATLQGQTSSARLRQDERLGQVVRGENRYPAAAISAEDLALLRARSRGAVLEEAVGSYASKSVAEDKAETARYLMSHLADALVQVATRPELAGSQRMLHVLSRYQQAVPQGPGIDWFVAQALERPLPTTPQAKPAPRTVEEESSLLVEARRLLQAGALDRRLTEVRTLLDKVEALEPRSVPAEEAAELVRASARLTHRLLRDHLQPRNGERQFALYGSEDANGVNQTLRGNIKAYGEDGARLGRIATRLAGSSEGVTEVVLQNLRLLARYHQYIAQSWTISPGTESVFVGSRGNFVAALPASSAKLLRQATGLEFARLAEQISPEGKLIVAKPAPVESAPLVKEKSLSSNPYLKKIDEVVSDATVRQAIRAVQRACVRLPTGSGVNLMPDGLILTNAHVANKLGNRMRVEFPNGEMLESTCVAIDPHLDLALCQVEGGKDLPVAPLAGSPPKVGTPVTCIGQPGSYTPNGKPTGYKPFHVSSGVIRGLLDNPLGSQKLGRAMHDAWTYWGHSGSPLFNDDGGIVALHNSWDSTTAMRRAVPYQAIAAFLEQHKVPFQRLPVH